MQKLEFLPVILGSDENAYGCARLFYEGYGVHPLLLCERGLLPTEGSRILTRRVIKDFGRPEVFRTVTCGIFSALRAEAEKLLLVPCSDHYVSLCVENRDTFPEYVLPRPVPSELYARFSDKEAFASLCRECGLTHPETLMIAPSGGAPENIPFDFPLVLKPDNSNSYGYLHARIRNRRKVFFCRDRAELDGVLHALSASGYPGKAVIQRYIPGEDEYLRVINAYCDSESNVRLIGAAQPLLQYTDADSVGNYVALRVISDRALCDEAATFLKNIKYVGFANFDLKIDPETGKAYFLELNPRPGRSSYYLHTAGKDPMKTLAEDVIFGKPFEGTEYAEKDGIWSNIPSRQLKKLVSLPVKETDNALNYLFDLTPKRLTALLKRNIISLKQLKNTASG